MGVFVVASAIANSADVVGFELDPLFRKASRGMIFSHTAMKKLLDVYPDAIAKVGGDQCGLMVGTSQGELGATKDFLAGLALKNVARPIVFQNSLHNSTLGFLSLHFGISGIAMTLSNGFVSGEDAIDTALIMLESKQCQLCVVIGFDLLVPGLEEARGLFCPFQGHRSEGAGALLLANEQGIRRLNHVVPKAYIDSVVIDRSASQRDPGACPPSEQRVCYEADGIANLCAALEHLEAVSPLASVKPDGTKTFIRFERL